MRQKTVISASRTKDLVHRNPDLLADILRGRESCRFGLSPIEHVLDARELHTVVLWTKDPSNLVTNDNLRSACRYLADQGVLIALHLTVTGFGSGFVEPGIPTPAQVFESVDGILSGGRIAAGAVTLRYDPLLTLEVPGSGVISNIDDELFSEILDAARKRGIPRVVSSACDLDRYKRARKRIENLGLKVLGPRPDEAKRALKRMAGLCRELGMEFDVCCNPAMRVDAFGCIDGRLYNRLNPASAACDEEPHNRRGAQRPGCLCTVSRDIGYSKGFRHCFTGGFGCIYCYSQGTGLGAIGNKVREKLRNLVTDNG